MICIPSETKSSLKKKTKTKKQNKQKTMSSEALKRSKLLLCKIYTNIGLYKTIVFIAIAQALKLLWQLKISIYLKWEK